MKPQSPSQAGAEEHVPESPDYNAQREPADRLDYARRPQGQPGGFSVNLPLTVLALLFLGFGVWALGAGVIVPAMVALGLGLLLLLAARAIAGRQQVHGAGTTTIRVFPLTARKVALIAIVCVGIIALVWLKDRWEDAWRRKHAYRAVSAAHLRSVAQVLHIYANDNYDRFPSNLQDLLDGGQIAPGQLQDPAEPDANNACDYWFVSYGDVALSPDDVPSDWVIAYSDPAYHGGEGANILFIDGHVEFVREPEFSKRIKQFKRQFEEKAGAPPVIVEPH